METRANYVVVGSAVLGAIVVFAVFVAWLAQSQLSQAADIYYTYFTGSVAGLSAGSQVRYRGVPIGTVGTIEIDPDNITRIRVKLALNPGTPIKTDSIATIELAGITGGSNIEITGGTQSSPRLTAPDDKIPVIPSQNSSLMSLEDDAPVLLNKLLEFVDRANSTLSPENIQAINQTLVNLRSASGDLAALGPDAKDAAGNLSRLVADLRAQLPPLITTLQQDGTAARDAVAQIREVASGIDKVIAENREPIHDFASNGLHETTALITQLRSLTDTLTRVADRLDRDPQRYLFGGSGGRGVDPNRPLTGVQR